MRLDVLLLLAAVASLANVAVAREMFHDVESQLSLKLPQAGNAARHLKGSHEVIKTDVANEEERVATQVISKLKSIFGGNPNKVSKNELKSVRSFAEENPDKWYALTNYVEYFYGISFVALMAGGALWHGVRPAGTGGPRSS